MQRKKINQSKQTQEAEQDQKPVWKKVTRGTLYPFPRKPTKVKPNDTLVASEEEIAKYRDHFELVQDGTGEYIVKNVVQTKPDIAMLRREAEKEEYKLIPIGQGLYNVESPSGKTMNDKGLKLEDAEALKVSLEDETEGE
jgi:hypothetical protein